jgi:hypothetical protein
MSVIVFNLVEPFTGKGLVAEERFKKLSEIFERFGATAKATKFIAGEHTGCIGLVRSYPDFTAASSILQKVASDPEYLQVLNLRETDPAGEMLINRQVARTIFGEAKWHSNPVSVLRRYSISRSDIKKALPILAKIKEITDKDEVNIRALLPVFSEDMSQMNVNYQFKSLEHMGEVLDNTGTAPEFQSLVEKANEFSTLKAASIMVPI